MANPTVNATQDIYLPETQNRSSAAPGILMLTADKTEDLEFFYPYYRFIEAGYRVDVVTPQGGAFKGKQGLGLKMTHKLGAVMSADYDLLYIPGGKAPAELKKNQAAIDLVKQFVGENKIIAAVCHGPQLLAAADVIRGRQISAWPEVEKEVADAGATYVDKESVRDGLFITARWPGDLPSHMKYVLAVLARSKIVPNEDTFPQVTGPRHNGPTLNGWQEDIQADATADNIQHAAE